MSNLSPWRHGDLTESISKFQALGATSIVRTLQTVHDILKRLDAIEGEDRRRQAAQEANETFEKGIFQ